MKLYLSFIYTRRIAITRSEETKANGIGVDVGEYPLLAELYCFGEKYQDIRLKNTVIDAIIANTKDTNAAGTRWYPTDGAVDIIYNGTPHDSLARKLMVDMHVRDGSERWLEAKPINYEFLVDLVKAFYKDKRGKVDIEEDEDEDEDGRGMYRNSKYHEPVEG